MKRVSLLILLSLTLLISGCSTKIGNTKHKINLSPKSSIKSQLYKEYEKHKKMKYKLGGVGLSSFDCSSFIQTLYASAFNIKLPRTTKEQVKVGYRVDRYKSKAGDLIFFKTAYNTRHIGVIIEKGKFLHVSQKRGVTISNINNPYWNAKYWQIRRIL